MVTIVDNEESPPSSVASGSMTTTSKPSYNVRAPSLWDWIVFTVQAFVHMGPPLFNSLFGLKQKWSPDDMEDQTGQVVLVTGANSGTGYETAKAYYEHGAKVLVACRSEERASRAIENIKKGGSVDILGKVNFTPAKGKTGSLEYINLDLADLDSVDKAAKAILDKETRLDVFFANAGIMAVPPGQYTKQGYSLQFGTNVIGHQRLISRLLPLLLRTSKADPSSPPRLVFTSSYGHQFSPRGRPEDGAIRYDSIKRGSTPLSEWSEYGESKWGNIALAKYIDFKYGPRSGNTDGQILAFSVHPGTVATNLANHLGWADSLRNWPSIVRAGLFTPAEGALNQLYAANLPFPNAQANSGAYIVPFQTIIPSRPDLVYPQAWVKLWDWCEEEAKHQQ